MEEEEAAAAAAAIAPGASSASSASQHHPALEWLRRAHDDETASTIFKEKVLRRPLLLRPSSPERGSRTSDARTRRQQARQAAATADAQRRRRPRKPQPLSARQKRVLGVYDIPSSQRRYAIYEPLHDLWVEYMREVLGMAKQQQQVTMQMQPQFVGPRLASADYHGALVKVVRSRCPSRVGVEGIVVKDTKFTFEVITRKDALKVIPKEHTVFQIKVPLAMPASGSSGPSGATQAQAEAQASASASSSSSRRRNANHNDGDRANAAGSSSLSLPSSPRANPRELTFEVYGSQFQNRAPERATKKFKFHIDDDV